MEAAIAKKKRGVRYFVDGGTFFMKGGRPINKKQQSTSTRGARISSSTKKKKKRRAVPARKRKTSALEAEEAGGGGTRPVPINGLDEGEKEQAPVYIQRRKTKRSISSRTSQEKRSKA